MPHWKYIGKLLPGHNSCVKGPIEALIFLTSQYLISIELEMGQAVVIYWSNKLPAKAGKLAANALIITTIQSFVPVTA